MKEENAGIKQLRLALSAKTAEVIRASTKLLGVEVPDRM